MIAVQNGVSSARLVRFGLDETASRIIDAALLATTAATDEPTTGTLAGDRFVYVTNSDWSKYARDGTLLPDARLTSPRLKALPIGRTLAAPHRATKIVAPDPE